jgi:hypothetical protein
MKKIILSALTFLSFCVLLDAQEVPQGINYQAVARDASGQTISDAPISVKVSLLTNVERGGIAYSEVHDVTTNKFGLFNLTIGQGIPILNDFESVPWDEHQIWMEIGLDEDGGDNFKIINTTKLLTVPYAFHAGSANRIGGKNKPGDEGRVPWWGQPWWNIQGLEKTDPDKHFVGNIDSVDLVFRTNNLERLRIKADGQIIMPGDVEIGGTLEVKGDSTIVQSLYVQGLEAVIDSFLYVGEDAAFGDNVTIVNNITAGGDGTFENIHALNNGTIDNALKVGGDSDLDGTLNVDGATDLNNTLDVSGATNLNSTLGVAGATTLNSTLNVSGTSDLKGQVTIDATVGGGQGSYGAYPLRVEGSDQGVAIKLNAGTPDNDNNFITFFDSGNTAIGRIEGETSGEATSTPEYIFETAIYSAEIVAAGVNIGLSLLPNACAGVGAVACPPEPSVVAIAIAEEILAIANLAAYNIFILENLGVTYQSGSADYAEWLERKDVNELVTAGDIVGVNGGKISKRTSDVEQYLVISTKPAMLGNMPMDGREEFYEKVAFMGQIPVKVRGTVLTGDYILPSGLNDGVGIGISPDRIKAEQYSEIVGIAWSSASGESISYINMAIGLNANDVARLAVQQEKRIEKLENDFLSLEKRLAALESGTVYTPKEAVADLSHFEYMEASVPPALDKEQINEAIQLLEGTYRNRGIDVDNHLGLNKLFNDAAFRNEIINKVEENYIITYQNVMKLESKRN